MTDARINLIAVGSSRFILGFALAGAQTILASPEDVVTCVHGVPPESIVLLDEEIIGNMGTRDRAWLDTSLDPLILTITAQGTAREERLRHMIVSTLGVDLLR